MCRNTLMTGVSQPNKMIPLSQYIHYSCSVQCSRLWRICTSWYTVVILWWRSNILLMFRCFSGFVWKGSDPMEKNVLFLKMSWYFSPSVLRKTLCLHCWYHKDSYVVWQKYFYTSQLKADVLDRCEAFSAFFNITRIQLGLVEPSNTDLALKLGRESKIVFCVY